MTVSFSGAFDRGHLARVTAGAMKGRPMRRKTAIVLTLLALAGTAPLLSACNTTAGAGQDLQAAGHSLERSADRHTNYSP
jgi:predicted small secreted protein